MFFKARGSLLLFLPIQRVFNWWILGVAGDAASSGQKAQDVQEDLGAAAPQCPKQSKGRPSKEAPIFDLDLWVKQRWPVAHVERAQETCSMLSLLEDFVATTQQSKIDLQARSGVPTTAKDPNCKGTKLI